MPTEYEPHMDADKTIPVLPRPLRKPAHVIRALNKTGDPTGVAPTDDMMYWQGLDRTRHLQLLAAEEARFARDAAIDALWG